MPKYRITAPDGKTYDITAPEGTSKKDALAYVQAKMRKPATPEQKDMVDMPSRVGKGMLDPVSGLAQMLHNVVPEGVRSNINSLDNKLYGMTGGIIGNPHADLNQGLRAEESTYQDARQATGQTGLDGGRLAGNLLSTIPAVAAGPALPASLLGRTAMGAATGGLLGGTNPVYSEGDYWGEKGKQVAIGSAVGGALTPVAAAAGRVISPRVDEGVKKLMGEGVTPSPGQIMGGAFKAAEEKARSIPILGDFITSAHKRSADELNRAAYNRALNPIGIDASKFPVGREGVEMVKEELGKAYEKILPKLVFQADAQFSAGISNLKKMAASLEPKESKLFEKVLRDKLVSKMTPQGRMSGESLKTVESELGKLAKGYRGDSSFSKRQLGDAIAEIQNLVRQTVERSSPQYAKELQAINKGYANYAVIRNAASRAGAQDGFTAAGLAAAAQASDKSVGKGATATGKALMQDLTDAGTKTLTQRYPDSGSIGRLFLGGLAGGSGFVEPAIPASLLGGGMAYTAPMQKILAGLLTKRPQGAETAAELVRASAPALGVAAPGLLQ